MNRHLQQVRKKSLFFQMDYANPSASQPDVVHVTKAGEDAAVVPPPSAQPDPDHAADSEGDGGLTDSLHDGGLAASLHDGGLVAFLHNGGPAASLHDGGLTEIACLIFF